MNLIDIAIRRPVFTTMIVLGLMVLGLVGMKDLDVDLFPDVSFPVVVIATPYPGASPEEVEQLVTKPIEDAVASINGVDKLTSFSRESLSQIIILFKLETPIKEAGMDVRDKVASVRGKLPQDIEEPVISRLDPGAAPVLTYTVSGKRSSYETRKLIEDLIKPSLEQVPGVAAAVVNGGDVREIQVELDGNRLEALHLTPAHVVQLLSAQNLNVPAGRLSGNQTEISVRTVGQFKTVEDIANTVLVNMNGSTIRVRDVGRVVDGYGEKRLFTRTNGQDSVSLAIQKNSGENTVEVVELVEKRLATLKSQLPGDIELIEIFDQSDFIKDNVDHVTQEIVFGGLMAILIIFVFMLDWRSTFISALALPTSVIATFFVMYVMGFTINMMTLLALSLAIGLLIDDSIVVRENIFRHLEMGKEPHRAALEGTKEIALAVLATTLTVVAVFVPVAFSTGMVGQFFKQFGITVAAAVLMSMFVAFTLDPMLSARLVKEVDHDADAKAKEHPILGRFHRFYTQMDETYRRILDWSLAHRKTVVFSALAMFIGSCGLTGIMGKEFNAVEDRGQFTVTLELPAHTSVIETDRVVRQAEKLIARNKEIVNIYSIIGSSNSSGTTLEANKATIRILATDKRTRKETLEDLKQFVRESVSGLPGVKFTVADMAFVEGADEPPIAIQLRGDDYASLQRLSEQATEIAKTIPGVKDISTTFVPGKPEFQVLLKRDVAADMGVNTASVGLALRTVLEGDISNKLRVGEDEFDIRVRLDPAQRSDRFMLENLAFPSSKGRIVYLKEFADIIPASGPSTIEREARRRQISLKIYIADRSLGDILADLQRELGKLELGQGEQIVYGGLAERMAESFGSLGLALALAVIFIYFVLASQFESFVHPFTIMIALPLAIVGAFTLLFLSGLNLGMSSMIGVVLLMGLVTKNSILLVDYTNQLRERGYDILEALLEAGPTRLRPILMTSAAIVLGMLPSALSNGPGSEFRKPMSVAVIGGVVASTFLTLVVVPVVYVWVDRFNIKRRKIDVHGDTQPEPTSEVPVAVAPHTK
jgi:hydrophobe/amphiphile efflux-1 (HAE1) family protein